MEFGPQAWSTSSVSLLSSSARSLQHRHGEAGMNKVATVSWWSIALLVAIVVLALVLAGR